jgi:predicted PurR-regulated permease PerM
MGAVDGPALGGTALGGAALGGAAFDNPDGARSSRYGRRGRPLRRTPFQFGLLAVAGGVLALLGFAALRQASGILILLAVAGFIAAGLNRPVTLLAARGLRRGYAVLAVVGTLLVLLVLSVIFLVPVLVRQTSAFLAVLPQYLSHLGLDRAQLSTVVTPEHARAAATGLLAGAFNLVSLIAGGAAALVLSILFLVAFDRLRAGAYGLVPASRRDRVAALGDAILDNVGGYLAGAIAIAAVAGTTATLWCLLFGISYPFALGLVVAGLDLIPQVGATTGAVIVCLVALTVSWPVVIASIAFFIVYQQVENWLIYPRVMSRAVHISNLAAIVAVLVGGALFGVPGVIVAVPVYAAVQLIVREVVKPRQDER